MNTGIMLQICLIWLVSGFFEESSGQIAVTQTPASIQANLGDKVSLQCKPSWSSVSQHMHLYEVKPGQRPKLLIHSGSTRFEGTPDRFNGSQSGNGFSFTINNVHDDDEGFYYCAHGYTAPLIFGDGTKIEITRDDASPSAMIFPPSQEQLETGSATAMCLVSGFYPSSLNVTWKVDGTPVSEGVQTSPPASDIGNTYRLSSTLTIPTSDFNSHESYSCEVTHKTLSSPLVKSFRRPVYSG